MNKIKDTGADNKFLNKIENLEHLDTGATQESIEQNKAMYVLFDENEVLGVFNKTGLDEEIEEYFGSFTSVKFTDVRDSGIEWIHEMRYDGMLGEESESTLTLKQYYLNEI